jgi:sortase A
MPQLGEVVPGNYLQPASTDVFGPVRARMPNIAVRDSQQANRESRHEPAVAVAAPALQSRRTGQPLDLAARREPGCSYGLRPETAAQRRWHTERMRTDKGRWGPRALMLTGLIISAAAAGAVAYPLWWNQRSETIGNDLIHEHLLVRQHPSDIGGCAASVPSRSSRSMHLAGILEIPSLGVRAPVLQGLSDSVLNVAVGHDSSSPWPGGTGESIIEAHDVSYFARISALKPGDRVIWVDACTEQTFRVIATEISAPGAAIFPPTDGRGLALITCYPTNALFWTHNRFVVEAEMKSSRRLTTPEPSPAVVIPRLRVPAPPALVAEGLTLQSNSILLGHLSTTGHPSAAFLGGPAGLDAQIAALESYFGAQKAIAAGNSGWWKDLAVPEVPMPPAWPTSEPVNVILDVAGNSVRSVTLRSAAFTMRIVVWHGALLIASVTHA